MLMHWMQASVHQSANVVVDTENDPNHAMGQRMEFIFGEHSNAGVDLDWHWCFPVNAWQNNGGRMINLKLPNSGMVQKGVRHRCRNGRAPSEGWSGASHNGT